MLGVPHFLSHGKTPYCFCKREKRRGFSACEQCGEEIEVHEWAWDKDHITAATILSRDNREVQFHPAYSSGTAAVRGDSAFKPGHEYYWEIKVLSPIYGTDVMIGVGTDKVNLEDAAFRFCSLLGSDQESWGLSYTGSLQHNGKWLDYSQPFSEGCLIGVHLDMWRGTIAFYINRKPVGIAFTSLKGQQELYPMVCSTAARTSVRVTYSYSCPSNLQLSCLRLISNNRSLLKSMCTVPGLKRGIQSAFWWLSPELCYLHRSSIASRYENMDKCVADFAMELATDDEYEDEYDVTDMDSGVSPGSLAAKRRRKRRASCSCVH